MTTALQPHVASRLPTSPEVISAVTRTLLVLGICLFLAWLSLFVCLCVLLSRANTPEVHAHCAGFWDCMLAATLAPVVIPLLYCMLSPCLWIAWRPYYGGSALVMAVVCIHATLTASQNPACVATLRATSEPLPLLLYAGVIKGALFVSTAMASHQGGKTQ